MQHLVVVIVVVDIARRKTSPCRSPWDESPTVTLHTKRTNFIIPKFGKLVCAVCVSGATKISSATAETPCRQETSERASEKASLSKHGKFPTKLIRYKTNGRHLNLHYVRGTVCECVVCCCSAPMRTSANSKIYAIHSQITNYTQT